MTYESFHYEIDDGIATVRLNNPEKLNALTFQTYEELERLTAAVADDTSVKVLLLTALKYSLLARLTRVGSSCSASRVLMSDVWMNAYAWVSSPSPRS